MKSAYSLVFRPSFLLGVGVVILSALGVINFLHACVVMALALTQNIAYTMQSRARMRTSDLYHGMNLGLVYNPVIEENPLRRKLAFGRRVKCNLVRRPE